MNIDYNAVIEIIKKFLDNEKIEILGISVGEERQVRLAIETLLTAYEKEKEKNELKPDCAEPIERTEEMVNMRWVNHNYISKDKIKAKIEELNNGTYDAKIVLQSLLEKEE